MSHERKPTASELRLREYLAIPPLALRDTVVMSIYRAQVFCEREAPKAESLVRFGRTS